MTTSRPPRKTVRRSPPATPVLFPDFRTFALLHGKELSSDGLLLSLPGRRKLRESVPLELGFAAENERIPLLAEVLWVEPGVGESGSSGRSVSLPPEVARELASRAAGIVPARSCSDRPGSTKSRRLAATTKKSVRDAKTPGPETQKRMLVLLDGFLAELAAKAAAEPKSEEASAPPADDAKLVRDFGSLSKIDQVKLAVSGDRSARGFFARRARPEMLLYLLQNPRISDTEIAHLAAMTTAKPDLLERIARNDDWTRHPAVRLALVTNPRTPIPLAIRFAPLLSMAELRRLSKARSLRGPIDAVVRRLVTSG